MSYYPVLDINDISLIKKDDVKSPVMKGYDYLGRKFCTIKCEFIFDSNRPSIESFSIFFQRYHNIKHKWLCSGNDNDIILMPNSIELNSDQFNFLTELIDVGEIELNHEIMNKCKICIDEYYPIYSENCELPILVRLTN